MKEKEHIYVLADNGAGLGGPVPEDFRILCPSDRIVFVNTIADCLNAERNEAEAVIWNSQDYEQLEELSPKHIEYGWMLVSINIPILFHITDINELEKLEKTKIHGFYSEDLNLLLESRKKVETLMRD